jgi:hypothetical protein
MEEYAKQENGMKKARKQTTWCDIPEDGTLHSQRCDNLKFATDYTDCELNIFILFYSSMNISKTFLEICFPGHPRECYFQSPLIEPTHVTYRNTFI